MSYWIKLFSDGTQEKGTDTNIARGKASWSKGRLASMIGAALKFGGRSVTLQGQGPYWQKDTFIASENTLERIARQIGKKIHQEDVGWIRLRDRGHNVFTIVIDKERHPLSTLQVEPRHIRSYLVATISNLGVVKLTVEKNFHV
jgi:hypothetical protein